MDVSNTKIPPLAEALDSGYLSELLSGSVSEILIPNVSGDSGINLDDQHSQSFSTSARWKAIYQQDENGDTLLHRLLAKIDTNRQRIHLLLLELIRETPHPDLLDIRNDWGQTALHVACEHDDVVCARTLICAGATADRADTRLFTPLHIAAHKGNLPLLKAIITPLQQEEIADLNLTLYGVTAGQVRTKFPEISYLCSMGMTPLHLAIASGSHDFVKELLPLATSTNGQEMLEGRTILHLACDLRRPDIVRSLLHSGVSVNEEDFAGKTALERALIQRMSSSPNKDIDEIISLLRSNGAIDSFDEDMADGTYDDASYHSEQQREVACV